MSTVPVGQVTEDMILLQGSEAITVYNRGYYGNPQSDGVILTGFEALHLLELGRIGVLHDGIKLSEKQLLHYLVTNIEHFTSRYLVYKDLRNRGYIVNQGSGSSFFFRLYKRGDLPKRDSASYYVTPLREGSSISLTDLDYLVKLSKQSQKQLIVGLVDASGDVSYLQISQLYPQPITDQQEYMSHRKWDWDTVWEDYQSWRRED